MTLMTLRSPLPYDGMDLSDEDLEELYRDRIEEAERCLVRLRSRLSAQIGVRGGTPDERNPSEKGTQHEVSTGRARTAVYPRSVSTALEA